MIARLQQDCDRLGELMKSVLAYSRPSETEMEAVNIGMLLSRLVERQRPRMSRAKVESKIQIEASTPQVYGNPRALEQVFTNLVTNAIQAMGENGGTLAVRIQTVAGSADRRFVRVEVADNGPGIPKEHQERLFQPFFTTKSDGTGLGLAITKRIITAHKGNIQVSSFPGGTVFQVYLPALETE
jgi:signal transduction histidine kinase